MPSNRSCSQTKRQAFLSHLTFLSDTAHNISNIHGPRDTSIALLLHQVNKLIRRPVPWARGFEAGESEIELFIVAYRTRQLVRRLQ